MEKTPSDVVELIIAVDLNPSDPEEPINVNSVDVRDKGEGGQGGEDWQKLTMQLLLADPKSGVTSDGISYDEAVKATALVMGEAEVDEEPDPFSKARSGAQEKPEMPMPGSGGGMKMALDRALGRKKDDEDEEEM